jgi:hypothetical protein
VGMGCRSRLRRKTELATETHEGGARKGQLSRVAGSHRLGRRRVRRR